LRSRPTGKGAGKVIYPQSIGAGMPEDLTKFQRPAVAVDVVLLAILHEDLKVALIQREDDPYHGKHALPGRFVRYEEEVTQTARMALETKGKIDAGKIFLEQLYTFGDNLERDTRIRTISILYYGLVDWRTISDQKDNRFSWHSVYSLPPLAFDHKEIIEFTLTRIRNKLFYSDLIFNLVPREFTLSELQKVCEIVLSKKLDKRNFRKKIMEIYQLKDLKKKKMDGAHRPASLYSYVRMKE
jgi:8-oxo-dGTP diphosphatase